MMRSFFGKTIPQTPANPIDAVAHHLRLMGYTLTPYGAGVALSEIMSGYNEVEAASHIALVTMALDHKEAGHDARRQASFVPHGMAILALLKEYRDNGMMHPAQWQNDARAMYHIIIVDNNQEEWITKVLEEPIVGRERLATSTIDYYPKYSSPKSLK